MTFDLTGPLPTLEQIRAERRARHTAAERENGRWKPRPYQQSLWNYLMAGGTRADVAAHRRWGKDDVALNWAYHAARRRVGTYWHMLPEASQARKAIWDAVNPHTGRRRVDEAFPVDERRRTRDNAMFIEFDNGSTWQVIGSDNFDSLVGAPPVGVVFSEWSLAKPDAWTYLRPILAENGGWGIFIWTPRGRNHAVRAFEAREQDPQTWFTLRSPATKTNVFTPAQLAKERAELIAECGSDEEGDAKYRQEYEVDFDAAVPGSYYGPLMTKAKDEERIGDFPYDPSLPVITAWDIGVDDYMAIWFLQENGAHVRAIDYYEASGEGAEQAAALLQSKPYRYSKHHLPHDVMVREWGHGGRSRFETLRGLGLKPVLAGVAQDPAERINAARRLLPSVSFDATRCAVGIDRLRNYRKKWNASLSAYTGPLHDENSHGADAFGEFAVNCRIAAPRPVEAKRTRPTDAYRSRRTEGGDEWMSA